MWDIKHIRENPAIFDQTMQNRMESIRSKDLLALDNKIRQHISSLQELQSKRNQIAKQVGLMKAKQETVPSNLFADSENINQEINEIEKNLIIAEAALEDLMIKIPNILADDVPIGQSEQQNLVIRTVGQIPQFDFVPKQHFEIGELLGQMDFKTATKIAGSRFVVLNNELALMERALINFMIDHHTQNFGYTEFSTPYLVNKNTMFGTGQLPKFDADSFETKEGFRLIPTAEVPLTNLLSREIIKKNKLPIRMTAYSPCFRSEVGSAGKDTRGMLRQHQFHKVELVSIVKPEDSENELERMIMIAEDILQKLELPYRVILLCSADTGFAAKKTYDIEVWLPGQNCYREISSCSNCGDFQSRRMKLRYRNNNFKQNIHLHTLNGSALAVGRTMVAIIENYQNKNGSIVVPKALQYYMNKTMIHGNKNG